MSRLDEFLLILVSKLCELIDVFCWPNFERHGNCHRGVVVSTSETFLIVKHTIDGIVLMWLILKRCTWRTLRYMT